MSDIRISYAVMLSVLVLAGTAYSVVYGTYLDTSNPLLTHLPHPLGKTHYWANKANLLNVYFIKYAWGWTSAAFFALWLSSPPSTRTVSRLAKWGATTCIWLVFTGWFFGPALIERFIIASGGDCYVSLPSGEAITVPQEYCFAKTPVNPVEHAHLFEASGGIPHEWRGRPRLRKGHDISGHLFLLSLASLFLVDQLRLSLRKGTEVWSYAHTYSVWGNLAFLLLWLLGATTTSIYFHSPFEKLTGLLLGIVSFAVIQIPSYLAQTAQKAHTS